MWAEKIKSQITQKRIKIEDVAKTAGMSRAGFYHSLTTKALKFDSVVKILLEYDIDFYKLMEIHNPLERKKEFNYVSKEDVDILLGKQKEQYEIQLKLCLDHNTNLTEQNKFLQQIIAKNLDIPVPVSK